MHYKFKWLGLGGRLVRDCHAEVLARRGLLKYLYGELNRLLKVENRLSDDLNQCNIDVDANDRSDDKGIEDSKMVNNKLNGMGHNLTSFPVTSGIEDTINSIQTPKNDITGFNPFKVNPATGLLMLKEDYILHLYTSSQPCGNATIKKWAKGKKAKRSDFSAGDPIGVDTRSLSQSHLLTLNVEQKFERNSYSTI